ncbi:MAG: multicopper oxidase domain-containing protein [Acidobacteriia bacterium]|nr:multicopper oxidase domain-containing protein [Terriglobia bacterium]
MRAAPSKADFTLRIAPVSVELAPGKTIRTAAYNGILPGPVLRMKEGKRIGVDLFNDTDVPELVHWHGQNVTAQADGAEEEGSPFVPPHGHLRVSFTPGPAGTRWYHTHAMAMDDLTKGAYSGQFGFLLVEPKSHPGNYDQEVFLAGRHWDPLLVHRGAPQNDWTVDYKLCTLTDRALGFGDPIRVKEGQRVLFRIVNADATRQLNLVLPGHKFGVIALDGNPVPKSVPVELLTVAVAERVDAVVEMNQPGVWVLGSVRDEDRKIGMGVVVEYANRSGEPQWKAPDKSVTWDYTVFGTEAKVPEPDGKFDLTFMMLPDEGRPFNRWMVNDKLWPNIDPLMVKAGKRYRIAFHNGMEDSHPLHLHRHSFELTSVGGKPTAGIIKDTVNVPRNGTVEADFVANNPGPSLLHCHMQQHMDYGFKLMVKYT